MRALSLYLDDNPGWRRYLVLTEGRLWVNLISLEDAASYRILRNSGEYCGIEERLQPRRMSKRLRAVAKTYGRQDSAAVKRALELLKEAREAKA